MTPPWTLKGGPVSKERALSTKRRENCAVPQILAKTLDQGQAFPGEAGTRQGEIP